jgi:hypothetical protein
MVVFVLCWCYGMVYKVKGWLCKSLILNKHILLKLVILRLCLGRHLCIRVYCTLDGKEVVD